MVRNARGFSLIELMIVVSIIGVLAAIAIPNYVSMQDRAREGAVRAVAHAVHMATEDYSITHDAVLPADNTVFDASMFPGGVWPENPYTGAAVSINVQGAYSQGDVGYGLDAATRIYTIEGYGTDATSGPAGDGVVIVLTNG